LRGFLVHSFNELNCFEINLNEYNYSQRFVDAIENGFEEEKTVQIKYERLADGTRGENCQLIDAAGALLPAFDYIDIEEK